jgi:hypothetical protein
VDERFFFSRGFVPVWIVWTSKLKYQFNNDAFCWFILYDTSINFSLNTFSCFEDEECELCFPTVDELHGKNVR